MNWTKAAEPGSTGADWMSRFHQFEGGKSGKGPGRGPLAPGPPPVCGSIAAAARKSPKRRRFEKRRGAMGSLSRAAEKGPKGLLGNHPGARWDASIVPRPPDRASGLRLSATPGPSRGVAFREMRAPLALTAALSVWALASAPWESPAAPLAPRGVPRRGARAARLSH